MTAAGGRFRWRLLAVALVALAVRIAYTLVVDPHVNDISDATTYHLLANQLADGDGWVRPYDLLLRDARVPTAEFPPLFPAVLGIASFLGVDSVTGHRVVACLIGTGTVVVTGLVGRRVAGAAAGLVAAAIAAVDPMLFQSDGVAMSESLSTLLVVAVVLLALRARAMPSTRAWLSLGAATGLAILARGEAIALVPLLVVPVAWRRWRALALTCAVAAAVVLPWTVRNLLTFDRVVPLSNNTGTLLAGANCDDVWQGERTGLWLLACADGLAPPGVDESVKAAREREAGVEHVRENLGSLPRVATVRLLRTFGVWEPSQQVDFETLEGRERAWQLAGTRLWWVLLPAAAGGAWALRRRGAPVWPVAAPFALVALTAVATYGNQRFRQSAQPSAAILAAALVVAAAGALARRRGPRAAT